MFSLFHPSHLENGPYQVQLTLDVGPQLHVLQLNIRGINRNKNEYLYRIALDNDTQLYYSRKHMHMTYNNLQIEEQSKGST